MTVFYDIHKLGQAVGINHCRNIYFYNLYFICHLPPLFITLLSCLITCFNIAWLSGTFISLDIRNLVASYRISLGNLCHNLWLWHWLCSHKDILPIFPNGIELSLWVAIVAYAHRSFLSLSVYILMFSNYYQQTIVIM